MFFSAPHSCAVAARETAQNSGKRRILLSGSLSPSWLDILANQLGEFDLNEPDPDPLGFENLVSQVSPDMVCVILQNPSFFGNLRDLTALQSECREWDVPLFVIGANPDTSQSEMGQSLAKALGRIPGIRVITDTFISRFSIYLGEDRDSADVQEILQKKGIKGCESAALAYPSYPELRPVLIVDAQIDAQALTLGLREALALVRNPR